MDFSTLISGLENNLSGSTGVIIMAIAGVLAIGILHYTRMHSHRSNTNARGKSYRHTVIAPYVEDEADPDTAMPSKFSDTSKTV